ncbi:MAG: hypothetical protein V1688_01500 [bacterium]
MLIQKNTNKDLTKSPSPVNFKIPKIVIIFSGAVVACVLILILLNIKCVKKEVEQQTIDDQIYNLSKKTKPSNFDLAPNANGEVGLPPVDQEKLGQEYIKDLKELISTLEQQIQPAGQESTTDIEAIKIIKKKAMSEVVPKQYQNLHMDFVRTLDLIINGDAGGAAKKLGQIKNNI